MSTTRQPAIVVGVSGSPASVTALRWAAAEAVRLRARLHAVLVWTVPPYAPYAPQPPVNEEERRQRAHGDLAAAVRAVFGAVLPDYLVTEVVQGQPELALADRSAAADLLVLGSAWSHDAVARSLGPVLRTCLSRAHCPVVVVGPEGPAGGTRADPPGSERQFAHANG
ncbi:MAG: universal stress protein [Streptosporangiaceae bacterium]